METMKKLVRKIKVVWAYHDLDENEILFLKLILTTQYNYSYLEKMHYSRIHYNLVSRNVYAIIVDTENKKIKVPKFMLKEYFNYTDEDLAITMLNNICNKLNYKLFTPDLVW